MLKSVMMKKLSVAPILVVFAVIMLCSQSHGSNAAQQNQGRSIHSIDRPFPHPKKHPFSDIGEISMLADFSAKIVEYEVYNSYYAWSMVRNCLRRYMGSVSRHDD